MTFDLNLQNSNLTCRTVMTFDLNLQMFWDRRVLFVQSLQSHRAGFVSTPPSTLAGVICIRYERQTF